MRDKPESIHAVTFISTIIMVFLLGAIDWASGYELQFFLFYFIPVSVAAWTYGGARAYATAVLSAGVWYTADAYAGHTYSHPTYEFWNTAIRLLSFLIIAYTVARIRTLLIQERQISADLQKALSEVKTLTGLLPICAACKKIRNDQGYWQQIEEYISRHTNLLFTHGYCEECAARTLREAGIVEGSAG